MIPQQARRDGQRGQYRRWGAPALAWLLLASSPGPGAAWGAGEVQAVRVENLGGAVVVEPSPEDQPKVTIRAAATGRGCLQEHDPDRTLVVKCSKETAAAEVRVALPIGMPFSAVTSSGPIHYTGLSTAASLSTDSGPVYIRTVWGMVRLAGFSLSKPRRVVAERGIVVRTFEQPGQWLIVAARAPAPEIPAEGAFFGEIRLRGGAPERVDLAEMEVPGFSWVKPPFLAASMAKQWLSRKPRPAARARERTGPKASEPEAQAEDLPLFKAQVRMANFSVAVTDRDGRPVTDLRPEEFEVYEDGQRQELVRAGAEEVSFNLAILLDLSGSTRKHREAMAEVGRRFAALARRHDRVAIYALANSLFYVISRLTADRARILEKLEAIPPLEGQTPLYDTILLACLEEMADRPEERNALIVITDGIDSSLTDYMTSGRSVLKPAQLRQAVAHMNVLVYPVLVGTDDWPRFAPAARRNLGQIAAATGGRVFEARSLEEMEPVYRQVEEELRSVYTLAYYPKNQNFDGRWRKVEVKVKRAGVRVRARDGYFAE